MELSGTGVWSGALRYGGSRRISDAAAELEALGYSAIWVPGGAGGDIFGDSAGAPRGHRDGRGRHGDPEHLDARARRTWQPGMRR